MNDKAPKIPWLLRIPPTLLSRAIYAWFPVVALFDWPPILSGIIALYLIASLVLLRIQYNWRCQQIKNNALNMGEFVYEERYSPPIRAVLINAILIAIGGIVLGRVLTGNINLSGVQWFLLTAGFMFVQQFLLLVWLPTTYLVTEAAIWILSAESQQFVWFGEVFAVQIAQGKRLPFELTGLPISFTVPNLVTFAPFDSENPVWDSENLYLALSDIERFTQFFSEERVQEL
jgi:hypothetical protein